MTFSDAGPVSPGQIAQQILVHGLYCATDPARPAVNADGSPAAHGPVAAWPYWKTGMQNGYQGMWGRGRFSSPRPCHA